MFFPIGSVISLCFQYIYFSLCFSEVWLSCALIWISLGLFCLKFAQLLKSVCLCLCFCFLQNLGCFKPLFNRVLFQFCPLFLSYQNLDITEVRSFAIARQVPEALFLFFFPPAYFLLSVVQIGYLMLSYLPGHCVPLFCCWAPPFRWVFWLLLLLLLYFSVINIPFSSLYCISLPFFKFVSRVFVIALWSILMVVALKCLSDNSNISVILVLAFIRWLSSFSLRSSWFLVWWAIFYWKLDIWGIMFWDSVSYFDLFSLASSDIVGEGVGEWQWALSLLPCGVEVQVPHLASVDTRGRGLLLTAGCG